MRNIARLLALDLRSLCLNVLSICHGFTSYKN